MFCPNINNKKVKEDFNKVVTTFGGKPMTTREFKSITVRNKRAGIDKIAMDNAYYLWDKFNGEVPQGTAEQLENIIVNPNASFNAIINKNNTPLDNNKLQKTIEYELLKEIDEDINKKGGQSYIYLSEKDAKRFSFLVEKNKAFPKEFKVTKKYTKYEKDDKNTLKFKPYNEYMDFYYIKSNNNKKSNLYNIVNKKTGEVIASKVRVLASSKDVKSKIAKKYGLEFTPTKTFSANRSISFSLYRQKPSKAKYIAQAKKYLYEAIKFLNPDESSLTINLDKIEEFLDSFPDEMWDYINTTYSPEDSTNINASITLQNEIKFNLPKLGLITELEKITGVKLQNASFKNYDKSREIEKVFKYSKSFSGKWGDTIVISNKLTTKELKAAITYYLIEEKKIFKKSTVQENVRKYAEHKKIDYDHLKELVFGNVDKALKNITHNATGNSDTIELSKWRESIRNYNWQIVELFNKPYENFQNTAKERVTDKFKDKKLSNGISHLDYFFSSEGFNWLNINFNNISGKYYMQDMNTQASVGVESEVKGFTNPFIMKTYKKPKAGENFLKEEEVFNRLAAILHEPFHALHALSYGTKEEIELRQAFDNLYKTEFGKEMMNQVFGSGYNNKKITHDVLYKEFTAFTTQLMLYPKEWITKTDLRSNDIYEFIEKIQTLQDKTYNEIIKTQQKTGSLETTLTKEEQIKLSFLEKLYNYIVKALNNIIPLSKKFTKLIADSKLVEKQVIEEIFGTKEEVITKDLKLPENVKKAKEEFLQAMDGLQSSINTLMQIDSKLFSSENINNFFTSSKFNQENNPNTVNYSLKAVDILSTDKAEKVFAKGKKNNWDLNKILTELQIPKEQKQIILDKFGDRKIYSENKFKEEIDLDNQIKELRQEDGSIKPSDMPKFNELTRWRRFIRQSNSSKIDTALNKLKEKNNLTEKEFKILNLYLGLGLSLQEAIDFTNKKTGSNIVINKEGQWLDNNNIPINDTKQNNQEAIDKKIDDKSKELAKKHNIEPDKKYSANELDSFVQKHGSKQVKFIWNLIKNIAQKLGVKTQFKFENDYKGPKESAGFFSSGAVNNRLKTLENPQEAARIIVHELVHGVTSYIINAVKNNKTELLDKLTTKQINAAKKLSNLLKQIQSDPNTKDFYGAKNEDELLAELTHDGFVEALKNKKLNYVKKFLDYIADILGISTDSYNEALSILKDMIETPVDYISEGFADPSVMLESKDNNLREEIITSLLADNSYTIEVNTAKEPFQDYEMVDTTGQGDFEVQQFIPDTELVEKEDEEGNIIGVKEVLSEKGKKQIEERESKIKPTQYYSNLTVPGGTNYTENEIVTPDITPNIKGHAQFSTDNGIGWFRNDERKIDFRLNKENRSGNHSVVYTDDMIYFYNWVDKKFTKWKKEESQSKAISSNIEEFSKAAASKNINVPNTIIPKTRRILEIQSDLFQKGRGKESLTEGSIIKNKRQQAINNGAVGFIDLDNTSVSNTENQFLQLLNKKNNWVTFFVKSIIQDSTKKGYEKVLFPKGDTAAKIERHETLEEFKRQKEARIGQLEMSLETDLAEPQDANKSEEQIKNEIKQLKQELADVESGETQLNSIANFYEIVITNILKKNGYNPVDITDEYGNGWSEVTITPKVKQQVNNILLLQNDNIDPNKPLKGGVKKSESLGIEKNKVYTPKELFNKLKGKNINVLNKILLNVLKATSTAKIEFNASKIKRDFKRKSTPIGSYNVKLDELYIDLDQLERAYEQETYNINTNFKSFEDYLAYVLSHELIHSVTSHTLTLYTLGRKDLLNKTQLEAIKTLLNIADYLSTLDEFKDTYAFKSENEGKVIEELLAELSNPEFVEKLKKQKAFKYKAKSNLFEQILDLIISLFNPNRTLANTMFDILSDIVTNNTLKTKVQASNLIFTTNKLNNLIEDIPTDLFLTVENMYTDRDKVFEQAIQVTKERIKGLETNNSNKKATVEKQRLQNLTLERDATKGLQKFFSYLKTDLKKVTKYINNPKNEPTLERLFDMDQFIYYYETFINEVSKNTANGVDSILFSDNKKEHKKMLKLLDQITLTFMKIKHYHANNVRKQVDVEIENSHGNAFDIYGNDPTKDISLVSATFGSLRDIKDKYINSLYGLIHQVMSRTFWAAKKDATEITNYLYKELGVNTFNQVKPLVERRNGKKTGFFLTKYRLADFNDERHEILDKWKEFDDEDEAFDYKENWLTENEERKYVPEYYQHTRGIPLEAKQVLDSIRLAEIEILAKYESKGELRIENVSDKDWDKLQELKKQKKLVGSIRDEAGNKKVGIALDTALAYSKWKKERHDKLQYLKDYDKFYEAAYAKYQEYTKGKLSLNEFITQMKIYSADVTKISKEFYNDVDKTNFIKWLERNTETIYTEQFWEEVDKTVKNNYGPEYDDLSEERRNLLEPYRLPNWNVDVNGIPEPTLKRLKEIDLRMKEIRDAVKSTKVDLPFSIVPNTKYYNDKKEAKKGKNYQDWYDANHIDGNPYYYYTKIIPNEKKHIRLAPTVYWSEIDPNSEWINPNYDPNWNAVQPKADKWGNEEYDKLTDEQKHILDYILEKKKEADERMSLKGMNHYKMPQVSENLMDVLYEKNGVLSSMGFLIKDSFVKQKDDVEYGDIAERTGTKYIRRKYTGMLEDPDKVSGDIISSLLLYIEGSHEFEQRARALPLAEGILSTIENKEYIRKKKIVQGHETNIYRTAENFRDAYMYGITETVDSTLARTTRSANSIVRARNLALKLVGMIANLGSGVINHGIDGMIGRYTNPLAQGMAIKEWGRNLTGIMNNKSAIIDEGNVVRQSKTFLMSMFHGAAGDFKSLYSDILKIRRINPSDVFYAGWKETSAYLSHVISMSIMFNHRWDGSKLITQADFNKAKRNGFYKDTKFKEFTTYYDMYEVDNGRVRLKKEWKDKITEKDQLRIRAIVQQRTATLLGELEGIDKSIAHRNAYLSLLTTHKNWLADIIARKFKPETYNPTTGMYEIGYYRFTFRDFIKKELFSKEKFFNLRHLLRQYKTLEPHQREAVLKTLYETVFSIGLLVTAYLVNAGSDEDDWLEETIAYSLNRILLEVSATNPLFAPQELTALLENPIVITRMFDDMSHLLELFSGSEIERGKYKGLSKRERFVIKVTPGLAGYYSTKSPEYSNRFLQMQALDAYYNTLDGFFE